MKIPSPTITERGSPHDLNLRSSEPSQEVCPEWTVHRELLDARVKLRLVWSSPRSIAPAAWLRGEIAQPIL